MTFIVALAIWSQSQFQALKPIDQYQSQTSKVESIKQKSQSQNKYDGLASTYEYLNVQCTGLSARPHPVLAWVLTTQDVVIVRPHIKMLAGDYLCFAFLAHDRGIDPQCRLCHSHSYQPAPADDLEHLLTSWATA